MNAIINTMLLRLQEVPGVLTCRHRFISVPKGWLDSWIAAYIADVELEGLLQVPNRDLDSQRWWRDGGGRRTHSTCPTMS